MVDVKVIGRGTDGAGAALTLVDCLNVGKRELAKGGFDASATGRLVNARRGFKMLAVFILPLLKCSLNFFAMLRAVALVDFLLLVRKTLAVVALVFGLVVSVRNSPALGFRHKAFATRAVGNKAFVGMSVLARFADRVVHFAALPGRNAVRMIDFIWDVSKCSLPVADYARTASRPAFGNVSIFAWFSGSVGALAERFRGFSFWNWFHPQPLVSDTLTVSAKC